MKAWWAAIIVVLTAWWVVSIAALAPLAATGIEPDGPPANRTDDRGNGRYDAHFQYYLGIRPLLMHDPGARVAMCDDGEPGLAVAQKGR